MLKSSLSLGRIAGIGIGVHYTWLLIFILIIWSLAQGLFPQAYPGWETGVYWATGVVAALLLFISVVLHELAHSLVAQTRGLPVRSITLFIFGGVSNIEKEPEKPRVEFAIAIVGPLTSLVLAGIFWGLVQVLTNQQSPFAAILSYLALINALLAVFNLMPAFPLDGGRVFRSIVWGITGSLTRATNIATTVGRFFGWALIALGMSQLFFGNLLGGLWIALIGWFISGAAGASRRDVTMREHLSGVRVLDVMNPSTETISAETSVQELVQAVFRGHHRRAVPVTQGGKLVGIVTVTDVRELPQEKWADTVVKEIMTHPPLYDVSPEDDLSSTMALIAQRDVNQVLVLSRGQLVGMISRADIITHLQFSQELDINKPR